MTRPTNEELERRAYADGDIETAKLLQQILDAEAAPAPDGDEDDIA